MSHLTQINFITNFALLGCTPPLWMMFDLAREPVGRLGLLIFGVTTFDLFQEIFDPRKGRRRKPARHGRKRRRGVGFPDINAVIAGRVRSNLPPIPGVAFGPLRYAFPIVDIYEGVMITAALIDTTHDILVEGYLGAILSDPAVCQDLGRVIKTNPGPVTVGYFGVDPYPVPVGNIEVQQHFTSSAHMVTSSQGECMVNFTGTCRAVTSDGISRGFLWLYNASQGTSSFSSAIDLEPGDVKKHEVFINGRQGDVIINQWHQVYGLTELTDLQVTGFTIPAGFSPF